jgi:hypothetical protein
LAADFDGNIYIGDFGNNRNDRTNLAIYKVHEDELNQKDTVEVQFIYFSYPDQNLFPPDKSQLNFDMEAMLYIYGNLYLFSKNRTEPFNGICNIYELPSEPGTYVSKKLDSINFGNGPKELFQITAADISPDGSRIALMSYDKMYLLHDVPFHDFTGGRMDMIEFVNLSQKESVIFLNDSVLLISDEKSVLGGGNLYAFNIASYIKNNSEVRKHEVTLSSKEFSDTLRVSINTEVRGKIYYEFYSSEGARVDAGTIGEFPRGKSEFILTPPRFPNGIYMLNIQVGKRPHGFFVYRNNPVDWDYVKKEMESPKSPSQNRQTK